MGILERAATVAQSAELYQELREGVEVSFRGGEIEKVGAREVLGRALRVIVDGKLGFASTAGEEEESLVAAALASAEYGDPAPFSFPELKGDGAAAVLDEETLKVPPEELISWGEEAVRAVKEEFPDVIVDAHLWRGKVTVRLANTSGGELVEARSSLSMGLEAQWVREGDIYLVWVSRTVRRRGDLKPEALVAECLRYLRWGERVVPTPQGRPPVLFVPKGTLVLLLPLMLGFSGMSVVMGTSPLKDRLGERAFDPRFTLVDDGRLPYAPGTRSFDDEGVPTGRLPLAEEGVVKNFFYDLRAAALAGTGSTGSGLRGGLLRGTGFRSPPSPSLRNTVIQPGAGTLEELIAGMKEGLIVVDLLGLGQGNIQSGAFSNNVSTGFAVKDGRVIGRVKNTMIAGNVYEVLKDGLKEIGGEPEWVWGLAQVPPLLVEGVSVVAR